ncbi:MAG: magnesium transporter, partial [gamma proteobacterium symbiont of Phacoides pectinatus]
MNEHEVAMLFERRDLISVAVLNQDGLLLGRITIDDIVDVLREEHDRALLSSAGLSEEEDLFAPVLPSARRRGLWLGINLITIFAAAWVIGRFEEALDKQECRYLVKDFGTSQSPKSTRQRDSRYCPD